MEICLKSRCTGCGACSNICPNNCISMEYTKEGFAYPIIGDGCINCQKCVKICPVNFPAVTKEFFPDIYAAKMNDNKKLMNCTSGGIFTVLAEHMIDEGGYVYGVEWGNNFEPHFSGIKEKEKLVQFSGSKYVQVETKNIYQDVKSKLDNNFSVLFSGLPCQISALYKFLEKKYENLLTIELLCHGVPSIGFFKKYLEYMEEETGNKVVFINQRDKTKNWTPIISPLLHMKLADKQDFYCEGQHDSFLYAFSKGLNIRSSCWPCEFAKLPRTADITIGDYGGLGVLHKSNIDTKKGVSLVMINSIKGNYFWKECNNQLTIEKRDLHEGMYFSFPIWRGYNGNLKREEFFDAFTTMDYKMLRTKYLDLSKKNAFLMNIKKAVRFLLGDKSVAYLMYLNNRRLGNIRKADLEHNKILEMYDTLPH